MKKVFFAIILIFYFSNYASAQSQMGLVSKFGLAAGLTPTWIIPDISELNYMLLGFGVEQLPTSGIFALGGGGYAYILFIDGIRIGGIGFGGTISSNTVAGGIVSEVEYSVGVGAFSIEYTLPFIKKFALSAGLLIGGGYREIVLSKNNQKFDWTGIWNDFQGTSSDLGRTMENKFFTITPTLNIDYPLNRFMAFRLGAGYLISFSDNWTIENAQELRDVPKSLSKNNLYFQSGIYIGFFAF